MDKDQMMVEMYGDVKAQTVCIQELTKDIKEVVQRTQRNEDSIVGIKEDNHKIWAYVKKHVYLVRGGWALLIILASILGFLLRFNLI
jgi:hypothetical protein